MSNVIILQFSRPDPASQDMMSRMISVAICKETRSEICHVDIEMPEGTLIGAHMPDGIQERPPNYQTWGLRIRVAIPVTPMQQEVVYDYARDMIGTPYDERAILGIASGDSRLHDAKNMICSGFGKLAIDDYAGIVRVAKDYWMVSPEELRLVVTAIPGAAETRIEGNAQAQADGL